MSSLLVFCTATYFSAVASRASRMHSAALTTEGKVNMAKRPKARPRLRPAATLCRRCTKML